MQNSSRLFESPLYISKVYTSQDDQNGLAYSPETTLTTNFDKPSVEVTYGSSKIKLSLDENVQEGVVLNSDYYNILSKENDDCNNVKYFLMKAANPLLTNSQCVANNNPLEANQLRNSVKKYDFSFFASNSQISSPNSKEIFQFSYDGYKKFKYNSYNNSEVFSIKDNNNILAKSVTISTINQEINLNKATIFLRKKMKILPSNNEGVKNSLTPVVCLIRKIENSISSVESEIACVERKKITNPPKVFAAPNPLPDYGSFVKDANGNISDDFPQIYANNKIYFNYTYGLISAPYYNGSQYFISTPVAGKESCLVETNSFNNIPQIFSSSINKEKYNICATRDECSKIFNECAGNELQIHRKNKAKYPYYSHLALRKECDDLLVKCKKKIVGNNGDLNFDYYNSVKSSASITAFYGSFNEICLSGSAIDEMLPMVKANKTLNGEMGKCVIDGSNSNCQTGGNKAKNCNCVLANDLTEEEKQKYVIRKATAREMGLCIDLPILPRCNPINYNSLPNSDISDLNYAKYDLNKYSNINSSHINRTAGTNSLNAEFPIAFPKMDQVEGSCNGYWKEGFAKPIASCNESGNWNGFGNSCIRYKCPEIKSGSPNKNYLGELIYPNNSYISVSESGTSNNNNKGQYNGFANWPEVESGDYAKDSSASSCIDGYKPTNSVPMLSSDVMENTQLNKIFRYNGGSLPKRACNQLGNWVNQYGNNGVTYNGIQNSCERIKCPPIDPGYYFGKNLTQDEWNYMLKIRGAIFNDSNKYLASKSQNFREREVYEGKCREDLGFYQIGSSPPTRECDYLGNWGKVENACATKCSAISDYFSDDSHGNAVWREAVITVDSNAKALIVQAQSCKSGYSPYPYSWPKRFSNCQENGTCSGGTSFYYPSFPFTPFDANQIFRDVDYNGYIDGVDLNNDSLDNIQEQYQLISNPSLPIRACTYVSNSNGSNYSRWSTPLSSCVNKCPGVDFDARIGIGRTRVQTSLGDKIINWPSTPFGETVVLFGRVDNDYTFSSSDNLKTIITDGNISNISQYYYDYDSGRSNRYFIISRKCGNDGRWEIDGGANKINIGCSAKMPVDNFYYTIYNSGANYTTPSENQYYYNNSNLSTNLFLFPNQSINGTCQSGYTSQEGFSPPSYSCVANNNVIDQSYYNLLYGANCRKLVACNIYNIPGINDQQVQDKGSATQTASCSKVGYSGNVSYVCNAGNLTIKSYCSCATGYNLVNGFCEKPRDCGGFSLAPKPLNPGGGNSGCEIKIDEEMNKCDNYYDGHDYYASATIGTVTHGTTFSFSVLGEHSMDCNVWDFYAKCDNGTLSVQQIVDYDNTGEWRKCALKLLIKIGSTLYYVQGISDEISCARVKTSCYDGSSVTYSDSGQMCSQASCGCNSVESYSATCNGTNILVKIADEKAELLIR